MKNHKCPNCNQPTIPYWKKATIGPLKKIKCVSCGALISVPIRISIFIIILSQLSALSGGILAMYVSSTPSILIPFILGSIIGVLPFFIIYNNIVPLVIKSA